jgi:hypothetical protein
MKKRLGLLRRCSWSRVILLEVLLGSIGAAGQLTLSSSTSSTSNLNFGSVQVGSSSALSTAVSNTGESNLTIRLASVSGSAFSYSGPNLPITVAPRQSVRLAATFTPQSAGGARGSMSVVTSTRIGHRHKPRFNTTTISLAGMGTAPLAGMPVTPGFLTASPSSMNFGSIPVASSQMLYETVTNSGGSSVTISQAAVTGAGFSLSGFTAPQTLAAGQSLTFSVYFAPSSGGTASGALTLGSNASNASVGVSLSGTGTSPRQLAVSPGSVSFGNVPVGTSQSQTGTLSAIGSSVTVSSGTSSSSEFALSGVAFPLSIAAGQSVPFTIKFAPQTSGTASANISFASNASSSSVTETATGIGASAIQHSVDLSWGPSPSTVVGYNVYRNTTPGGPYTKINSSLDPSSLYTDSTVQSGQTYYYVTTAVDSMGVESGYSNQLQMVVPSP